MAKAGLEKLHHIAHLEKCLVIYLVIIIILSDDYNTMKKHLDNYLKTGDTKTPNRGRGLRISKRNLRYESGDDQGEEDDVSMSNPVMIYNTNEIIYTGHF